MLSKSESPARTAGSLPPQWRNWKSGAAPDIMPSAAGIEESPEPTPADRAFLEFIPEPAADVPPVWEWPNNDDGRASYFLKHFGGIVRYVPEVKQWRVWHGSRWHSDTTGRIGNYCQLLSRAQLLAAAEHRQKRAAELAAQMAAMEEDASAGEGGEKPLKQSDLKREAQRNHAMATALGNEKTIAALVAAASRSASVIVPLSRWDADPQMAGTENGVLDLRTRTHRPGRPEDYITKTLAVSFDPAARCPQWEKFLNRILPEEIVKYVQKLLGYSLTGSTDDQAFYFCYGAGKNGKSILIKTVARLFGDYAGKARGNLIEKPKNGADCKHDLAQVPGVRFLHGEETERGAKLREETVKALTAGDILTGEIKFQMPFSFTPVAKLWIMGNSKPRIEGSDAGIWRRVRLIPFTTTITKEEEIPEAELLSRLAAERSGILNWMLEGLAACPAGPIPMPLMVRNAVAEYRADEDELGDFIEERIQDATEDYREPKAEVYKAYRHWAEGNGIRSPMTLKQFTRRMGEREGWQLDPGRRAWTGKSIRLG